MAWTFNGVAFDFQPASAGGVQTRPTWQRRPRLVKRPLLGTGDADIVNVGFEPWTLSGAIYATAANVASLEALNGAQAVLSDGTSTWTAVMELTTSRLLVAAEGAVGDVVFTRARA